MSGSIPRSFIDDLIARVDIVQVINSRYPLKKAGSEYKACCPFHNEKTPSFHVIPAKQFYHCFGCGANGTAISFLMQFDNLSFVEAIEELATAVGLEVPRSREESPVQRQQQRSETERLLAIMSAADNYFRQQLRSHPQAERAVNYLQKRGLSGEIVQRFSIGYAPPVWDGLMVALRQFPLPELIGAGLVKHHEERNSDYDRFRDRIIFPILDQRGRVIAFGGRVLEGDGGGAKYLNSPETALFHKGNELYGLFEMRQQERQIDRVIVVEGYMDVVSLAQFGVHNVVATLGTSITSQHLQKLFRICHEIVFCFDGDRAGRDAAWRGLENSLPQLQGDRQVRFLFLPDGEDPDTMIRRDSADAFRQRVADATPLSTYLLDHLSASVDLRAIDGRARLLELARPLIEKLPQGALRQLLNQRLAVISQLQLAPPPAVIARRPSASVFRQGGGRFPKRASSAVSMPQGGREKPSLVRQMLALLLQQPMLAQLVDSPDIYAGLQQPGIRLLVALLHYLKAQPQLTLAQIIEHWREDSEGRYLQRIAGNETLLAGDDEALKSEFVGAINELQRQIYQQQHEQLLEKLQRGSLSDAEKQEYQQIVARLAKK
ncbi:MAG: DNA primase [Gammaproteobacteria bacterium]|nr:DNA primase [Gammaproteobacteria bacterium]